MAARLHQVRDGRAQNTPPELAASLPWGCSANWSLMVVTALGHYPGSGVDQRQTVDTKVDTARSGQRQRLNKTQVFLRWETGR